jgi:prepilin-type N-terminal cleavage/methylation domain-containing protein
MHDGVDRNGFSLLEVLFATTILTVAVMSLAQVIAVATHANASARTSTLATMLAAQKMEQLRALTWSFDAAGVPVSDLTSGIVGLSPSPPGALERDVDGYSDWLDASGRAMRNAGAAAFVRRWSVAPLPTNPDTLLLQVLVAGLAGSPVRAGAARLVTVKTRKGPCRQ